MPRALVSAILIAAALLLGLFYVSPEWTRFQNLKGQVAELEEISSEFDELIADRDKLLSLVNSISKDNLARVDKMLPQGPHASDFLVSMEALTIQSGMVLRRIDLVSPEGGKTETQPTPSRGGATPGATTGAPRPAAGGTTNRTPPAAKEMQELPFNLQVAGSYAGFKKFLAALERNLRLIDVEDVSFTASGKADSFEYTVKATTYYQ